MTQSKIGCGPVDSVEPMREMLYGNRGDQFKDLQNIPVAENAVGHNVGGGERVWLLG